ncbi:SurA N-terminal domain-containing protein [candidate division CSSED10-310 bacterium]|uniref:Periplasmic chaperone PpiD n=1 Tax=candidate division CSSED10-310 bacterium TaxID=2855610 RepID=A0ABV6YWJ9_UNCC1
MLNAMRRNLKKLSWVLWLVIAAFVGTIFAVWGVGGGGGRQAKDIVAWIDEKPVTAREFYEARQRVREFYQRVYGDKFSEYEAQLQLSDTALAQIIQNQAVLKAAHDLGIYISQDEIQDHILKMPEFHEEGQFSLRRYRRLLQVNHIEEDDFVSQMKTELARSRVQSLLQDAIWVSQAELEAQYRLENEQMRMEFLQINSRAYTEKVKPEQDEIAQFFEQNMAQYQIPEKVSVRYLVLDPNEDKKQDQIMKQVDVTALEIEDYYFENEDKYRTEREVKARHILFQSDGSEPEKDKIAREKAAKILTDLKAGADFEEMAKKFSEGPSAPRGGDLGYFPRQGKMVESFAEAAFALEKGQISDIVKTQFGYHIIKVDDIKPEDVKTLEEATAEIRDILVTEQVTALTEKKADRIREVFDPTQGLEPLTKRFKLKAEETDLFAEKDIIPALGWAPEFSRTAFSLAPDQISPVVKEKDKYYLMVLNERVQAHQASLDEVQDKVKNDLIDKLCLDHARTKMAEVQAALQDGASWSSVADGDVVKIGDTDFFNRKQPLKGIGRDEEVNKLAFQSPVDAVIGPKEIRNMIYLLRITAKQEPDWQKFETEKDQLQSQLLTTKRNKYYTHWLDNCKSKMEVSKNPNFFKELSS